MGGFSALLCTSRTVKASEGRQHLSEKHDAVRVVWEWDEMEWDGSGCFLVLKVVWLTRAPKSGRVLSAKNASSADECED